MNRGRIRAEVQGIVQGVGFRPFIYRIARDRRLAGFVLNTSYGAMFEVEGAREDLDGFFNDLREKLPPLASLSRVDTTEIEILGETGFVIRHSEAQASRQALISPDVSVCVDCLAEMFDSADRRFRYPFINCTNCGPRYTIIMDVPYDREKTSMKVFEMCPDCAREYNDPADRRFHAQPNACPVCGPAVWLADNAGKPVQTQDPIRAAADLLRSGAILAIKGLGGFHLAANAVDEQAVRKLRSRKRREEKPLAVMSPDLETIHGYARVSETEERILESIQRPIVLLDKQVPFPLAPAVAPDNKYIGAFLPYTPLHHLLIEGFTGLVMTSGNLSEEPICIDNDEALERLGGIADYFLLHNRDIYLRSDDSVVRAANGNLRQVRRSRGYAPAPIFLAKPQPGILAVGGELKSTVCLTKGDRAFLSQHIGDLENRLALDFFEMTIGHLRRILDVEPEAIAYDLHPEYLSTKWALEQRNVPLIGVQHHHAHVAGAMAENRLEGPVLGLSCDGTGYGPDGAIWGGELLLCKYESFERLGHLDYLPLPGGAAAIKEPWRMAVSYLEAAFGTEAAGLDLKILARQDATRLNLLRQVIAKGVSSPPTSSLGRLFDGAAALAGLRDRAAFEGQAAMMLEMHCPGIDFEPYSFEIGEQSGQFILHHQPIIRGIVQDLRAGKTIPEISGRFHRTVIDAMAAWTVKAAAVTGVRLAVLSGGCFQNRVLTEGLMRELVGAGFDVYTQNSVPVNDGGLSLGQAVVAGARLTQSKETLV